MGWLMNLDSTLEQIANYGPSVFYEGEMGKPQYFGSLQG